MDLVNEYLRAVAALLPKAQRDDIIAELRDTILTRIEEREGDLGRPLSDDEVEAVLREVGHPVVVAARYAEGPQHVVGPTLYPYWLFAVKAAIVLQVAIALMVIFFRSLAFGDFSWVVGHAVGSAITGTLVLIGVATCAAWFFERRGGRIDYLDNWRVRDLRYLEMVAWNITDWSDWFARQTRDPHGEWRRSQRPRAGRPAASRTSGRSRADSGMAEAAPPPPSTTRKTTSPPPAAPPGRGDWAADLDPGPWHPGMRSMARGLGFIAFGSVLVLWWTGVLPLNLGLDATDWGVIDMDPGALDKIDWTALRHLLFWPVLAYLTVILLQGAFMLAYPFAVRLNGLLDAIRGGALLAFCLWLWNASPLAPAIGAMTRPEFAHRMSQLRDAPPLPLAPIVTLIVLSVGLTALIRMLMGLWSLAFGGPADYAYGPPHGGISNSAM
ncbi:MAG: HAAS signaling domain-containing protein [Phenylobacterium sp.]